MLPGSLDNDIQLRKKARFLFVNLAVFVVAIFLYVLLSFGYNGKNNTGNLEEGVFDRFDFAEEVDAEDGNIQDGSEEEKVESEEKILAENQMLLLKEKEKEEVQKEKKQVLKKATPSSIKKEGIVFYHPLQFKKDHLGRLVCIHDKDKPSISKQDKPIHADMECCLDYDEIPNPYCYYPAEKYGKVLADYERKKEKLLRRYHNGEGL